MHVDPHNIRPLQNLLARLALPQAGDLPAPGPTFEAELTRCFAALDGILALEE